MSSLSLSLCPLAARLQVWSVAAGFEVRLEHEPGLSVHLSLIEVILAPVGRVSVFVSAYRTPDLTAPLLRLLLCCLSQHDSCRLPHCSSFFYRALPEVSLH